MEVWKTRAQRVLNTPIGFLICLALAILWVLTEKAAVDFVSRATPSEVFHARGYQNDEELWKRSRFQEISRNHSLHKSLVGSSRKLRKRGIEEVVSDIIELHQTSTSELESQAQVSILESHSVLTANKDVLHELWNKYCYKPGKTRICDSDSLLRPFIEPQSPTHKLGSFVMLAPPSISPAIFAVYGSFVCLLAAASAGEFVSATHMILTLVVSRAIRTVTFLSTTLGPLNPNCRVIFSGASESGGCGDLLFSGHGTVVTAVTCLVWVQTQPRCFLIGKILITFAAVHSMWASAVERFHYTADMVLAVAVTLLVFIALDPITGFSKRRSTKMSSPIHAKHYLPTMVVAPLVYGVLKLLGVLH
eukprot:gene940-4193_t